RIPGGGEGLAAGGTAETALLEGVDADVAVADQPSSQAVEIRAKLESRVHRVFLRDGCTPRMIRDGPFSCASQPAFTVAWGATSAGVAVLFAGSRRWPEDYGRGPALAGPARRPDAGGGGAGRDAPPAAGAVWGG